MQPKLRFLVLKHLGQHPLSGYRLASEIEEATGWRPSYGSIYPLLNTMREEGLLICKEEGRRKVYSLTKSGEAAAKALDEKNATLLEQAKENMKLIAHMCGMDEAQHDEMVDFLFSAIRRGETPFKEVTKPTTRLKLAFWQLQKRGILRKHKKEVAEVLNEASARLEAMQ